MSLVVSDTYLILAPTATLVNCPQSNNHSYQLECYLKSFMPPICKIRTITNSGSEVTTFFIIQNSLHLNIMTKPTKVLLLLWKWFLQMA